jgi:DNA-binding transcriptional regulator YiaG
MRSRPFVKKSRQSAGPRPLSDTSQSTVQKWETGAKRLCVRALKLLSLVQKHGLQMFA